MSRCQRNDWRWTGRAGEAWGVSVFNLRMVVVMLMLVGGDRRTVRGGGHRRGRRGSRRRLLLAVGEALRRPRGRPRGGRRGHDPDRPVRERRGRRRDGGGGRRGRRGQDQVHHRMDITLSVVSVGRPAHNSSLARTVISR